MTGNPPSIVKKAFRDQKPSNNATEKPFFLEAVPSFRENHKAILRLAVVSDTPKEHSIF
jgi:hypothetical protein